MSQMNEEFYVHYLIFLIHKTNVMGWIIHYPPKSYVQALALRTSECDFI